MAEKKNGEGLRRQATAQVYWPYLTALRRDRWFRFIPKLLYVMAGLMIALCLGDLVIKFLRNPDFLSFLLILFEVAVVGGICFWFVRYYPRMHAKEFNEEPQWCSSFDCPVCGKHVPELLPWQCGRCEHLGQGENTPTTRGQNRFVDGCITCGKPALSLVCPNRECQALLFLRDPEPGEFNHPARELSQAIELRKTREAAARERPPAERHVEVLTTLDRVVEEVKKIDEAADAVAKFKRKWEPPAPPPSPEKPEVRVVREAEEMCKEIVADETAGERARKVFEEAFPNDPDRVEECMRKFVQARRRAPLSM